MCCLTLRAYIIRSLCWPEGRRDCNFQKQFFQMLYIISHYIYLTIFISLDTFVLYFDISLVLLEMLYRIEKIVSLLAQSLFTAKYVMSFTSHIY